MSLFKNYSWLLLFAVLTLAACSKDDDGGSNNTSGTLTAEIDGQNYSATVGISASVSGTTLVVQGGTDSGETIRLNIGAAYQGVGIYQIGGTTIHFNETGTYIQDPANPSTSTWTSIGSPDNSGEINITSDDGEFVEGTFRFKAFNANDGTTKDIIEGKFRAKIN